MVNYCCVTGCGRNSKGSSHLLFYSLPKEVHRQEIWCQAVGRQDILVKPPEKRSLYRVCSKHFDASSVKTKHLSMNAVPTLFLSGSDVQDEQSHDKITCNNCRNNVVGFRYKCITCENYDLCSRCEMQETHGQHYMLRIPVPAKFEEIHNLMKKIQYHKDDSGNCSSDDEPITKYKKDHIAPDLDEDVKQKIRNEVNRVYKTQVIKKASRKGKKRTASTDKTSKHAKTNVDVNSDPFFGSEMVFADVNHLPMSVSSVVEVKTENHIYEMGLEEQTLPIMDMKLTEDLNELMMEVNEGK